MCECAPRRWRSCRSGYSESGVRHSAHRRIPHRCDSDGNVTNVTVWHGRGEATGGGDSYVVVAGQRRVSPAPISWIMRFTRLPDGMISIVWAFSRDSREDQRGVGQLYFSGDDRLRGPRRVRPLAAMSPTTDRSGRRRALRLDGHHIATAIGFGSRPGDGHGSKTSLGVSLPSTMDGGHMCRVAGAGCRARLRASGVCARPGGICGRRRFLAEARA